MLLITDLSNIYLLIIYLSNIYLDNWYISCTINRIEVSFIVCSKLTNIYVTYKYWLSNIEDNNASFVEPICMSQAAKNYCFLIVQQRLKTSFSSWQRSDFFPACLNDSNWMRNPILLWMRMQLSLLFGSRIEVYWGRNYYQWSNIWWWKSETPVKYLIELLLS